MINLEFKSVTEFKKVFFSEQICIEHLEKLRWNGTPVSPFNPKAKVYKCANNRYKCKESGKYFNVKTGTIFDNSKMPIFSWFMAIFLFNNTLGQISSTQLSKELNITQKSAWIMLQRIKELV